MNMMDLDYFFQFRVYTILKDVAMLIFTHLKKKKQINF